MLAAWYWLHSGELWLVKSQDLYVPLCDWSNYDTLLCLCNGRNYVHLIFLLIWQINVPKKKQLQKSELYFCRPLSFCEVLSHSNLINSSYRVRFILPTHCHRYFSLSSTTWCTVTFHFSALHRLNKCLSWSELRQPISKRLRDDWWVYFHRWSLPPNTIKKFQQHGLAQLRMRESSVLNQHPHTRDRCVTLICSSLADSWNPILKKKTIEMAHVWPVMHYLEH